MVYYGGYAPEAGLIIRQARNAGDDVQLVVGDGVATEDFSLIAGPAGAGTLMTLWPDVRENPAAAAVVAKFRAANYEPAGATLNGYATIQVWAQAVEPAGTLELEPVAQALRSQQFDTVLGTIGFDAKGDVTGYDTFAWHIWKDGEYTPVDPAEAVRVSSPLRTWVRPLAGRARHELQDDPGAGQAAERIDLPAGVLAEPEEREAQVRLFLQFSDDA